MKRQPKPVVTHRRLAIAAVFTLLFYFAAIGWRGFVLIRTGQVVGILLGLALLALPVVGMWAVIRELRFGVATEILGEELEARGALPADDLPRSPGGRVDRAAADAWFEGFKREVEAAPESWEAWFRLAVGYDAAGDRRRGREAMRKSIELHGPLVPVRPAHTSPTSPTSAAAAGNPLTSPESLPPMPPLPPLTPPSTSSPSEPSPSEPSPSEPGLSEPPELSPSEPSEPAASTPSEPSDSSPADSSPSELSPPEPSPSEPSVAKSDAQ